jgi:hypothetical protein
MSMRILGLLAVIVLIVPALQACYSYVPVASPETAPSTGRYVELQITDRGRVGLGPRFGAGVRQISGTFVTQQGTDLVLSVDRVSNIEGGMNRWSGDTTRIDRDFVATMTERRVSAGRTALLLLAAGAVVYATTSSGLLGGGKDKDDDPAGPINQTSRVPRRPHFSRDLQLVQLRLWRIVVP